MEVEATIHYSQIPHFPVATMEFHAGQLILGRCGGKKVVAMKGRFHFYEGYSTKEIEEKFDIVNRFIVIGFNEP